jgi:hypothetical protein
MKTFAAAAKARLLEARLKISRTARINAAAKSQLRGDGRTARASGAGQNARATRPGETMSNSPKADETAERAAVEWIDRNMATQFANVVNVQGTREQIDLFFGTNRTWNVQEGAGVAVELSNRIILTPFAAKRLWTVLGGVLREYETRHGDLDVAG